MAEDTKETKAKGKTKRGPRRNFARILADVEQYCRIKVEVLESISGADDPEDELQHGPMWKKNSPWKSSIDAYKDVLKRLGGAQ